MSKLRAVSLVAGIGLSWTSAALADDVMLVEGGRVRGTVIEESPTLGVRIKLLDGTIKVVPPGQVKEVRYDGDASAERSAEAPKAKAARPPEDEEDEEALAPKRRRRRTTTTPDWGPLEAEKPKAPEEAVRSARGMIISGAVLTSIGFAGAIAGAVTLALSANQNGSSHETFLKAGGIGFSIGASMGITGSVLLGVGVENRRELRRDYAVAPSSVTAPNLGATMTVRFE